jgi:hypothetical protein
MALVGNLFEKLARSPEETRAENCNHWARSIPDTTPIGEIQARDRCRPAGVIRNIRIDPQEGSGSIEARIFDGTGEMVAKWLGRSSMAGIKLGEGLVLEGIVGKGSDGSLVMLNPEYELVPGPERG